MNGLSVMYTTVNRRSGVLLRESNSSVMIYVVYREVSINWSKLMSVHSNVHAARRPTSTADGTSESSDGTDVFTYPYQQMPQPYTGLPVGFQPYADQGRPVIPPVIPDHRTPPPSHPPVIPQPQPTIIVQPGGVFPGTAPVVPMDGYHPIGPGRQPTPRIDRPTEPFIPPDLSPTSTGPPRDPLPVPMPQYGGGGLGPNVIHVAGTPSSSRSSSTRSPPSSRRRPPRDSRRYSRSPSSERGHHGRRRDSRSYTPSGRRRSSRSSRGSPPRTPIPLVITNPSAGMPSQDPRLGRPPSMYQPYTPGVPQHPSLHPQTPIVHVVPPSAGSMMSGSPRMHETHPQPSQPTIIIQQPPQQQQPILMQPPQPPPSPYHYPTSDAGMPMTPMTGVPMTGMPGMPMTGVPMTGMPGMPMSGMPMTGVPMTGMPGIPMSGYPPGGPPMIIQQPSRSSSRSSRRTRRSRSGSRHRRTPPPAQPQPAQPIIITDTHGRRSRSSSRRRHTPPPVQMPTMMPAGMTVLPSQYGVPPPGAPPVVMMPRSSSSRSRRRSRSPTRHEQPIIVQPGQTAPTMYPAPMSQMPMQPQGTVLIPQGPGMQPVIMRPSRSSSRSRSPRRSAAPIILPPQIIPSGRSRSRHRSRSYSPRSRRPRSPQYYDSRAPSSRWRDRSRSRSPTHRRRSRSPSDRRRSRSPVHRRSRSPRPSQYHPSVPMMPTILPGMRPSHYGTHHSRSRSPTRRSRSPPHRARSRSPRRVPSRSPPRRARSISRTPPRRRSPTRVEVVGDPYGRRSPSHRPYTPSHPRYRSPRRYSSRSPSRSRSPGWRRQRDRSPGYRYGGRSRRTSPSYHRRPRGASWTPSYDSRDGRYPSRPRTHGGRRSTSTPTGHGAHSRVRSRSMSPPPIRSPTSVHRTPTSESVGRRGVTIQRPSSAGSPRSMTPPRILPPRQPTGYVPTEERERGEEGPVRITVPSRQPRSTQRPPTIMSIGDEDGERPYPPGVSRQGTLRRPSGKILLELYRVQ